MDPYAWANVVAYRTRFGFMSGNVRFYDRMLLQTENLFCFMTAAGGGAAAAAAAAARTHVLENRSRQTDRQTGRHTCKQADRQTVRTLNPHTHM